MDSKTLIVQSGRTPIGSFGGELSEFSAPQLGAPIISDLINHLDIDVSAIEEVIMGNVLSAGIGQAPARQTALYAGLPDKVECLTINKMCGSGLKAVMLGDQAIKADGAGIIIAGGIESMSNAPYLISKDINRFGHQKMIDSMLHDGLWDVYNNIHMGSCAEMLSRDRNYTRKQQDGFSIKSYQRAQEAQEKGYFKNEIIPLTNSKGDSIAMDEEPGKANFEKIPLIKPVFEKDGTITAANASKLNDGAAAVVLMSADSVEKHSLKPIARILSHCSFAHDPKWFTTAPGKAIDKVLNKSGLSKQDIDLWEINEAFAAVTMAAIDDYNLDDTKGNIYGGAVAL